MIRLEELVSAVQTAVSSATSSVARQNLEIIQSYFDEVTDGDELESIVRSSLSSVDSAIADGDDGAAQSSLREAAQALAAAAERMRGKKRGKGRKGGKEDAREVESFYVPKRVTIQYPYLGPGGKPSVKNVQVPLITLVPLRVPEVAEVRFKANLELSVEDDGSLNVSFAQSGGGAKAAQKSQTQDQDGAEGGDRTSEYSPATIDIIINNKRTTDGLLKIVEGYEKALRAQIPG